MKIYTFRFTIDGKWLVVSGIKARNWTEALRLAREAL